MNPTRRAFLSLPLAALPRPSTAAVVPPDLVELARAYAGAAAHVLAIQPAYDRVCLDDRDSPRMSPRMRRFVRYILDPATEAIDRTGMALAEAIDRHRLDGVLVDGRLYLGNRMDLFAGCDDYDRYSAIVRVERIAGLDAHHQRSTDRC